MGLFPKLKLKKSKIDKKEKKEIAEIVEKQMTQYVSHEELAKYYKQIEKDDNKKRIWNSLPANKKIRFLKYLAERNRSVKK